MIVAMCLLTSHIGRIFEKVLVGFHIPAVLCSIAIVAAVLGRTIVTFKTRIGSVFGATVFWLAVTALLSIYHRGSAEYLVSYLFFWVMLFLIISCAPRNFVDLKKLFYTTAFACFLNLVLAQRGGKGRLGLVGTFGNADDVALMAGFAIPLWIFCITQMKNRLLQIAVGGLGLIYLLRTVALTATRSALLGLACMFLIYLVRSGPVTRIFLIIVTVVAAAIFATVLPQRIIDRFKTISEALDDQDAAEIRSSEAIASIAERRDLIRDAINMTVHHPLFGIGPGQFGFYRFEHFKDARGKPKRYFPAHNTYLQISSEQGLLGLVLYLTLLFQVYRSTRKFVAKNKRFPEDELGSQMALCMEAALIFFAFCAFFMNCDKHPYIFVLGGFCVAYERLFAFYRAHTPAAADAPQTASLPIGTQKSRYPNPLMAARNR
ncbi:MAG TPA: O-antigen ligase family protein [Bryobacteraceae bacterium]|jgi:O-antigen ligase|nr:O-antigen ligase family protein [Bryobacteraceae bacterium]